MAANVTNSPGKESPRDNMTAVTESETVPPRESHRPAVLKDFASTGEMLEFIAGQRARWPADPDSQKDFASPEQAGFFGTRTWGQTLELAAHGWLEGERLLVETGSRHITVGRDRRKIARYDVAGA